MASDMVANSLLELLMAAVLLVGPGAPAKI